VNRPHLDLGFREHITLWPMAVLMLAMGVLSPYWIKAIDPAMAPLSAATTQAHTMQSTPSGTAAAVPLEKQ
jgi:NADH-quinone oxidoreductase subunit M